MRVVEKRQLISATEIDRTCRGWRTKSWKRAGDAKDLALIGIGAAGCPLPGAWRSRCAASRKDVPVGTLDITLYRDDLSTIGPQPVVQSTNIDFTVDDTRSGCGGRCSLHRANDPRGDERSFRPGAAKTHPVVRADRSRASRAAGGGVVRGPDRADERHRNRGGSSSRSGSARSA